MTKSTYLFRRPVARVLLLALAAMVASLSAFPQAGYAQTLPQQPSGVVLVPPNSIEEGTPLDCVYDQVQQGIPIDEALAACGLDGQTLPENPNGIDSQLGFGGGYSTGTTVGSVSCSSGADPRISDGEDLSDSVTALTPEAGKLGEAEEAYQKAKDRLDDYVENGPPSLEDMKEALRDYAEKSANLKAAQEAYNKTNPTGGGKTSSDPNADDACQQAAEFVAQCNVDGWQSARCQIALDQMEGCDPMITDPMPGEEACGDESQPDPEEVERVTTLVCSMEVNPSDPDQDPCAPIEVDVEVLRGIAAPGDGNFKQACGDVRALTGEEQCLSSGTHPSVIVAKFRGKDIEEIMRVAQEKLGGPGWGVPMLGPGAPGPGTGPQPETGEPSPSPPLP